MSKIVREEELEALRDQIAALEARVEELEAENAQLKTEAAERGVELSGGGRFTFVDGGLAICGVQDSECWYIQTEDIPKIIDFLDDIQNAL